jgi:hypothetical protein
MNRKGLGGWSAYHRSTAFRLTANAALARYNASRPSLPKCGAKRKRDGEPCTNIALGNGRCRFHGGRTPSGDSWHRPVWPNRDAPDAVEKMHAKLRDLEKAAQRRARRLLCMTDAERKAHEAWHRDRPATSAADRAERKRLRNDANNARELMAAAPKGSLADDPEYQSIVARIAELKVRLSAAEDEATADNFAAADKGTPDQGVFG